MWKRKQSSTRLANRYKNCCVSTHIYLTSPVKTGSSSIVRFLFDYFMFCLWFKDTKTKVGKNFTKERKSEEEARSGARGGGWGMGKRKWKGSMRGCSQFLMEHCSNSHLTVRDTRRSRAGPLKKRAIQCFMC